MSTKTKSKSGTLADLIGDATVEHTPGTNQDDVTTLMAALEEITLKVQSQQDEISHLKATSCSRCGQLPGDFKPAVDHEELQHYFKVMLTQQSYRKEYQLFEGNLVVVLEEPTTALARLQGKLVEHIEDEADRQMLLLLMVLVRATLKSEDGDTVVYNAELEDRKTKMENRQFDVLDKLPLILKKSIEGVVSHFMMLCSGLIKESQDQNFWKGVGLNLR